MLYGKTISIIFASPTRAQDDKVVIGKDGDVPWRGKIPSDMKRFVGLTTSQSVVMGRKTWDSIPLKFRPLPNRQNIIVTRNPEFIVENYHGVNVVHSFEEAVRQATSPNVWIAGGAEIYALALPVADFIHQTFVYERFEGDTFFPNYDKNGWRSIHFRFFRAGGVGTEKDELDSAYSVLERKK